MVSKSRKVDYREKLACVLCGTQAVNEGKIFKGYCICGSCVDRVKNTNVSSASEKTEEIAR